MIQPNSQDSMLPPPPLIQSNPNIIPPPLIQPVSYTNYYPSALPQYNNYPNPPPNYFTKKAGGNYQPESQPLTPTMTHSEPAKQLTATQISNRKITAGEF